jgi:mannosyltransferase
MDGLRAFFVPARRLLPLLLTAAVAMLALCLRIHGLGRESLWLDEGFSWQRAHMPVRQLIPDAIAAHHNPTYFLFLHYWLGIFGDDEFMLRLPSAISGAIAAGATSALGWVLGGPAAGLVAGVLLALSPLQVHFGQEARMYAALCASATISAAAVFWFGTHPEAAARPILRSHWLHRHWLGIATVRPGRLDSQSSAAEPAPYGVWSAYGLGMLASLYLHNTAVIFAATLGLAMLPLLIRPFRQRLGFLINFVAANLLLLSSWGVYLRTELAQAERFSNESFWATFPTRKDLFGYLRELYLMTAGLLSPLGLSLLAAALLGVFALRRRPEIALAAVCFAAFGPALMLFVSTYKPIFGTRLLLWVSPPFFALVGTGVAQFRPHATACSLAFMIAIGVLVRPQLERDARELTNEPWREVMSAISARRAANARILTATFEEATMFDYYMHRRSRPFAEIPFAIRQPGRRVWTQLGGATRVWIVDRKSGRRFVRLRRELETRARTVWDRAWHDQIRVIELEPTRPTPREPSLN